MLEWLERCFRQESIRYSFRPGAQLEWWCHNHTLLSQPPLNTNQHSMRFASAFQLLSSLFHLLPFSLFLPCPPPPSDFASLRSCRLRLTFTIAYYFQRAPDSSGCLFRPSTYPTLSTMRSTTPRSIALYILLSFSSLNIATASPAEAYAWPAGIDPGEKYWPLGTGPPSKRWLQEFVESSGFNQSSAKCSGVKKLSSEDPSEKFYWDWEHLARSQQGFLGLGTSAGEKSEDVSAELPVNAYRAPHRDIVSDHGIIGVLLGKRQTFECAVGTQSCSAVGVPGSCCDLTETCERIPDIGFGNIGCCPKGL